MGTTHRGALTRTAPRAHSAAAPGGRTAAGPGPAPGLEESPGSIGPRCRLTAGGGDPRESATESKPPGFGGRALAARPRAPGKGERVRQERTAPPATGAARQTPPGARPNRGGRRRRGGTSVPFPADAGAVLPRRPGWPREARREARPRGMAVPSPLSTGLDRTRLTGRLAPFPPQPVHRLVHRVGYLPTKERNLRNSPRRAPHTVVLTIKTFFLIQSTARGGRYRHRSLSDRILPCRGARAHDIPALSRKGPGKRFGGSAGSQAG